MTFNKEQMEKAALDALLRRKVDIRRLGEIVVQQQLRYHPNLSLDEAVHNIHQVLKKTEVQHAVITGIQMDELAEKRLFDSPLQEILETDEGLYGVDEILAMQIVQCYGSIAFTTFGLLDQTKPGIIGDYNNKKVGEVHTFLDDILCALAGAACSRIAHNAKK